MYVVNYFSVYLIVIKSDIYGRVYQGEVLCPTLTLDKGYGGSVLIPISSNKI